MKATGRRAAESPPYGVAYARASYARPFLARWPRAGHELRARSRRGDRIYPGRRRGVVCPGRCGRRTPAAAWCFPPVALPGPGPRPRSVPRSVPPTTPPLVVPIVPKPVPPRRSRTIPGKGRTGPGSPGLPSVTLAVLLVLKGLNWGGIGGKLGLNRRGNPECPECLFDPRLSRLGHGGEGRVAPGAARGRIAGVSRQG